MPIEAEISILMAPVESFSARIQLKSCIVRSTKIFIKIEIITFRNRDYFPET